MRRELPRILAERLPGVKFHVSAGWAEYTSMGAGAAGFFLVEPDSMDELFSVAALCDLCSVPLFPIGCGTNLIGSDTELEICFLRLGAGFRNVSEMGEGEVFAGAGSRLSALLEQLSERGIGGAAALSGIPGSVGGALRMNAGANGVGVFPERKSAACPGQAGGVEVSDISAAGGCDCDRSAFPLSPG